MPPRRYTLKIVWAAPHEMNTPDDSPSIADGDRFKK